LHVAEDAEVAVHRQQRALAAREAAREDETDQPRAEAVAQEAHAALDHRAHGGVAAGVAAERVRGVHHAAPTRVRAARRARRSRMSAEAISASGSSRPTLPRTRFASARVGST